MLIYTLEIEYVLESIAINLSILIELYLIGIYVINTKSILFNFVD